ELLAGKTGSPRVGFVTGAYDRRLPLVIDPVFGSRTILGGAGEDIGHAIGVDGAGNVYIAGSTASTDFIGTILAGSLQPANGGGDADAFVTKIDAAGGAIVYSTYLGSSGDDEANHIAVDSSGSAVIAGGTCSPAFPVTAGALQTASPGADCGSFL